MVNSSRNYELFKCLQRPLIPLQTVDPCDSFYEYACGSWKKYHPIPKDRVGNDIFEILRSEMDEKLIGMLTESPSDTDNNATAAAKLLYASCMNEGT